MDLFEDLNVESTPEQTVTPNDFNTTQDQGYHVFTMICRGPNGCVYEGQMSDGTPVVIQRIARSAADFTREANLMVGLDHPNVIRMLNAVAYNDYLDIVLERGVPLTAIMAQRVLPLGELVKYLREITLGLDYLHREGLVHCDIKPHNIIVVDGVAKVADFGSAVPLPPGVESTGLVKGTAVYMSPEATRGLPFTRTTDIWSLGVLLYHVATGHIPYHGYRSSVIAYKIGETGVLPALEHPDPTIVKFYTYCTEKVPASRATTPQLLAMLRGL